MRPGGDWRRGRGPERRRPRAARRPRAWKSWSSKRAPSISYGACGLPYFVEGRVRERRASDRLHARVFPQGAQHHVRTGARWSPSRIRAAKCTLDSRRARALRPSGDRHRRALRPCGCRRDCRTSSPCTPSTTPTGCKPSSAKSSRARGVVVGAGYIGLEAADALRRNGLRVTVLERVRISSAAR